MRLGWHGKLFWVRVQACVSEQNKTKRLVHHAEKNELVSEKHLKYKNGINLLCLLFFDPIICLLQASCHAGYVSSGLGLNVKRAEVRIETDR